MSSTMRLMLFFAGYLICNPLLYFCILYNLVYSAIMYGIMHKLTNAQALEPKLDTSIAVGKMVFDPAAFHAKLEELAQKIDYKKAGESFTLRCSNVLAIDTQPVSDDSTTSQLASPPATEPSSSSRPPSPPSTNGTTTPRCSRVVPPRWEPTMPPPNYGAVEDYAIFRSSFPQDRNLDLLKSLNIRSVLALVDTKPTMAYQDWIFSEAIKHSTMEIGKNKDGKVKTTPEQIYNAILFIMNRLNHPVHIHCNQGKHRTGCVVACYRKIHCWEMDDIIEEYRTYAGAKAREGDIKFIEQFDVGRFFTYARKVRLQRADSGLPGLDDYGIFPDQLRRDLVEATNKWRTKKLLEQVERELRRRRERRAFAAQAVSQVAIQIAAQATAEAAAYAGSPGDEML